MSIDTETRRRLILGFLANWVSKLAYSTIQLVQVPFFLLFWSPALYGEWIIVTAIPNQLGFSDMGFGSAAGNEMTMLAAREDREGALRVFQSCWWLIVALISSAGIVAAALLYLLPVAQDLHLHSISTSDTRWVIGSLGVAVLFGQLEQLMQSAYRCIGRYPFGTFIKSCITLGAFAAMLVPVAMHQGPRVTAIVFAAANIVGTLIQVMLVRRDIPWLRFGWRYASVAEIRRLTRPALASTIFSLGFGFNTTGTTLAVSYALGPIAVVVFSTARTVSRIALQMAGMINATFEPEFSKSYAQKDIPLIRSLHRHACQAALFISSAIVLVTILLGPEFLHHWTHGKVPPSRPLLSILLLVVVVYSLWSTSSVVMTATNRHQRLAAVYLGGTAATVAITYVAAVYFGLLGAAASLLVSDSVMTLYVLPNSLHLTHDTFHGFLASLLKPPPQLHPRALLRRLSRSKPVLEN